MSTKKVAVRILDREYILATDQAEDNVIKSAAMVDEKIRCGIN